MSKKAPPIKYLERAIYTGRRITISGKVRQRFEKPNGEEMFFSGVKGVWLGYTYQCGESSISAKPERISDAKPISNPDWEAQDALVDARNAEKRAENKLKESTKPALKNAIQALRPLMKGMSYFERRMLIDYLAEQARKIK